MTTPETLAYDPSAVPFRQRVLVHAASAVANVLSRRNPKQVAGVLRRLRSGAAPAGYGDVWELRSMVEAASLYCAGREGCLRRSLTIALLCRLRGRWATWCVGVRTVPPMAAHAWVEADGVPVGENVAPGYFTPLISVAPEAEAE